MKEDLSFSLLLSFLPSPPILPPCLLWSCRGLSAEFSLLESLRDCCTYVESVIWVLGVGGVAAEVKPTPQHLAAPLREARNTTDASVPGR